MIKIDDLFSIKNKVIIITGAGNGIGKILAEEMWKRNAIIYSIDKIFSKGKKKENYFEIKSDITNIKKFNKICSQIFKKHNKIDILINNAGITFTKKENEDYPIDKWEQTLKINLTGAFTSSQTVSKFMKKQKNGSIINITSINAELGFPRNPAYVASKGGLKMLGKSLAKDWGKYGIRVNNLGPGYIRTDMTGKTYSNKKLKLERAQHTMLGRWGEKEDLVGPCIFLASDASKYMTGQDVYVDGGWISNSLITEL